MSAVLTRRQLLCAAPGVAWAVTRPESLLGQDPAKAARPGLHAAFPSHDPTVVRDVVAAAHTNPDRVRELVEASPALAKVSWDWGFGDWESALGAASHMGRRDIADLLLKHGARPNLFTFAMLGKLEAVKACVAAMPGVQRIAGPHGITLLQHATNGGEPARAVVKYLESLGDADRRATSLETTDRQKKVYVGRYVFGKGPDDAFDVVQNRRGKLGIKRGSRFSRALNRVEQHGFAPAGAPDVRVRFRVKDGRAVSLSVHDPVPRVTATRAD